MSWVYTSFGGKVVNIRATMFDDPSWFAPFIEVQCAEKLPWAETRARYAFDREPDSDAFSAACDEYEALIDSKEH